MNLLREIGKIKKYFFCFLGLLFLLPFNVLALESSYEDVLADMLDVTVEENIVNIYFFYGDGCPHCAKEEKVLNLLEEKYGEQIKIYRYETWSDEDNLSLMYKVKKYLDFTGPSFYSVPYTIIGTKTYSGYTEWVGTDLENQIRTILELDDISEEETVVENNKIDIPLLGEIDAGDVTVGVAAVTLGFVDGFNPCAMWVLLFIIDMLFGMKDKRKMFFLGYTFLFTSALFYFISMLGINNILGFISTTKIRNLIGAVAIVAGIYNLYMYYQERKNDDGCHVVDEKKRKKIISRVKKIKEARNLFIAFWGIVVLAISVNMVELACSAGFPTIFNEVLVANNITGIIKILYLLLYVLFYMLDDIIVFTISVCTLSIAGMTTKYNKLIKVIGGVLMILMGLLLIFKPAWIMLNF